MGQHCAEEKLVSKTFRPYDPEQMLPRLG